MIRNIAILVHGLWSGGAERIAGLLSKELAKTYNVYLFLFNVDNIVYDYGGTIVDVGAGRTYEKNIAMCKKKYHIDCAISFLANMNLLNVMTKDVERVIVSVRCIQSIYEPSYAMDTAIIRNLYKYADMIVACAEGVKFDLSHNYQVPGNVTRTIYNFIDKEGIVCKSQENLPNEAQDFLKGADFFLNVGRLHPQKNQRRLILQFSRFHAIYPRVKLLILGSGESCDDLTSYIEEQGLVEFIKILPFTKNPFAFMKRAKALILSSRYEGLPNVVLEAMTLACPVIATDCLSGPRELLMCELDYGKKLGGLEVCDRGILVCDEKTEDDGTTQYMAKAMEMIYSSETMVKSFRGNGLKYMEEYTNQSILNQWIDVINESVTVNKISTRKKEEQRLQSVKYIVIYGAGMVGKEVFRQLSSRYKISCFVISERKEGEEECLGIPVYGIAELEYSPADTLVVIGVGKSYLYDVFRKLREYNYTQITFPYLE